MSAIKSLNWFIKRYQTVNVVLSQQESVSINANVLHDIAQNSLVEVFEIETSSSKNSLVDMLSTNETVLDLDKTDAQSTTRNTLLPTDTASNGGKRARHAFHNSASAVPNTVGTTYNTGAYSTSSFKKRDILRIDMVYE